MVVLEEEEEVVVVVVVVLLLLVAVLPCAQGVTTVRPSTPLDFLPPHPVSGVWRRLGQRGRKPPQDQPAFPALRN